MILSFLNPASVPEEQGPGAGRRRHHASPYLQRAGRREPGVAESVLSRRHQRTESVV